MASIQTPDDATGDSVILARVHVFLTALLAFLGFKVLPAHTVEALLEELTSWLETAKAVRRDPQGATARIWWDAFKMAWQDDSAELAAARADNAAAEFGKRFLPVNDDGRDTFDTADFEALRTECDRLDANIALLESKTDDLQQSLDGVIAERDALLKANAHHASELEFERGAHKRIWGQCASFKDALFEAIGERPEEGIDVVERIAGIREELRVENDLRVKFGDMVELRATERDKLKELRAADLLEMASVANALDAIREVVGRKDAPDAEVSAIVASIIAERDELKRQLASAIMPLPKPERVEPGQLWSMLLLCDWPHADGKGGTFFKPNGERIELWPRDIQDSALQFTGTR